MASRLRSQLSFANVMSSIAVFMVLGGGAYAVTSLPGGSATIYTCTKKKNGALRVVKKGKACRKDERSIALNQQGASGQQGAPGTPGAKGDPGSDATVNSTDFLRANATAGGDLAGAYPSPTLKAPESWHEVGTPGEPFFHSCRPFVAADWQNLNPNFNSTAAFYRDPFGVVHLKGTVKCTNWTGDGPIFILPPGYRPTHVENYASSANNAYINIVVNGVSSGLPAGMVKPTQTAGTNDWVSLDGISFRCGPSGSNGCP